jgi:hypothetical protein
VNDAAIEDTKTIIVSLKINLNGFTSLSKYFISTIFNMKNSKVMDIAKIKTCSIIHLMAKF